MKLVEGIMKRYHKGGFFRDRKCLTLVNNDRFYFEIGRFANVSSMRESFS